ncbi:hypothetical protein [Paraurantiacibacter namhicola]|uniref:Amidase n=1 Tax=Paraurantiacibacter namhicola TaxID=645517 RepID=A0A1C7D5W1_9SPHN|nr:hypothetical protein [Paraurantiacibacter namhicola]ANU06693.1 hypothetical protein A6F65_00368 [Paraurantiacibacter namhicola]
MATAKRRTGPKAKRTWLRVLVVLLLVVAAAAWFWRAPITGMSGAGAAYGARIACSCKYVGGRDLDSCRADLEDSMWAVFLSEDEAKQSVTARVPLVASETATYREGQGCVLESWED